MTWLLLSVKTPFKRTRARAGCPPRPSTMGQNLKLFVCPDFRAINARP